MDRISISEADLLLRIEFSIIFFVLTLALLEGLFLRISELISSCLLAINGLDSLLSFVSFFLMAKLKND